MSNPAEYCRAVETYLCEKNRGHLIRLVGPAFGLVRDWAEQGIPLKVVMRGIDTRVARLEAKSGRWRSLHIEFCESDVLRAFDDWRRAVGSSSGGNRPRGQGLPKHLTNVMSRLSARLMASEPWPGFHAALDRTLLALDPILEQSRTARGPAYAGLLEQLKTVDGAMMRDVRTGADEASLAVAQAEAEAELGTFRDRMSEPAFQEATELAIERHFRAQFSLPRLGSD
ncbi:MAG: hypothetical protein MK358_00255 [Vicinamibacterales bacterium]|nr:hypothetical protein [Vicinamibacterales bacterium]